MLSDKTWQDRDAVTGQNGAQKKPAAVGIEGRLKGYLLPSRLCFKGPDGQPRGAVAR